MTVGAGQPAEYARILERCINDLVGIVALPAMWSGRDGGHIVRTLLDTVTTVLDLDLVFINLPGHPDGNPRPELRHSRSLSSVDNAEVSAALDRWLLDHSHVLSPTGTVRIGNQEIRLAALRIGVDGEVGVLIAGSQRSDFPQQTELLILNVVANQAVIGFQEARRLAQQQDLARVLDERVAQRTRELADANESLLREIEQRRAMEDRLRSSDTALREAFHEIQHSESRLRQVIDTIPALAWCNLPDGPNEFLSKAWHQYTGLTPEESHGWGWQSVFHPDDLPALMNRWGEMLVTGESGQIEARLRRHDGVYRWFLIRAEPFLDEKGKIFRWYGTSTDIEELKQTQRALQDSEARLDTIINATPAMVWTTRPDGFADFFNATYLAYLGLSRNQLLGWGWTQTVHSDDLPRLARIWNDILTEGTSGEAEARMRRSDGEYRWFLMRAEPMRDESGAIVKWFGLNTDIEDRKRAEAALEASERSFRSIINTIPITAWTTRPDGYCEFLNEPWFNFTGLTKQEAEGWGWISIIHPDDLHPLTDYWKSCLATGTQVEVEGRLRRFDGVYRWFLFRAIPLRDASGNISQWFGTGVDIDDRKHAEEALRASETSLRAQIDSIPGLVCTMSATGDIEEFNRPLLEYFGKSPADLKRWGTTDAVHPDDLPRVRDVFGKAITTGAQYDVEHRCRRYDGVYRWFQVRALPVRDISGRVTGWYVLLTDIEDRKRAEQELLRSQEFLREGQNLARLGNFSWIVDSDEITWSEQLYHIFEFEPGEAVTLENIRTRVHPDDLHLLFETTEKARRAISQFEFEHRLLMPNRSVKHIRVVAHIVPNKDGRLEYIGAVQDVTERYAAEANLTRARTELANVSRVTSLGVLTASIAHEVNQPISGIVTNASTCLRMLASDPPNIEGARETARRAIRDGNRASEVISRLRSLFTRRENTIEPLNLNEAAREVLALTIAEFQRNQVIVRSKFADDLPIVRGDRVQLQQVILNLMRNAVEAMSVVYGRQRELTLRTERDNPGFVRLSVSDVGVGLDRNAEDRLFQPFFTTKADGMGIGLSISRSIIEAHQGRLWAKSNDGPGATFCFTLPIEVDTKV